MQCPELVKLLEIETKEKMNLTKTWENVLNAPP